MYPYEVSQFEYNEPVGPLVHACIGIGSLKQNS